jgi:hypothetical protein
VHIGRGEAIARDTPITAAHLLDEAQVTGRRFSPSISTTVSVILRIISCFCSCVKTLSITFTVTIGICVSLHR